MVKKIIFILMLITAFQNHSMNKENFKEIEDLPDEIVEELLNDDDDDGNNVLHTCVLNENLKNLKIFITYDADLNAINKKGETPLQMAIEKHNFDIVRTLVYAQASLNNIIIYKNKLITPLEFAKELLSNTIRELAETKKKRIEDSKNTLKKIIDSKESLEKIVDYLDFIECIMSQLHSFKYLNTSLENLFLNAPKNSASKKYLQYCFAYFLNTGNGKALKLYYDLNKKYLFDKVAALKTEYEYELWITDKIIDIKKSTLLANYIEQSWAVDSIEARKILDSSNSKHKNALLKLDFNNLLTVNDPKKFKLLVEHNKEIASSLLSHNYIWANKKDKKNFLDILCLYIKHWSDLSEKKAEEQWAPIIGMLFNDKDSPLFTQPKIKFGQKETPTILKNISSFYGKESPITKEIITVILKKHNLKH